MQRRKRNNERIPDKIRILNRKHIEEEIIVGKFNTVEEALEELRNGKINPVHKHPAENEEDHC